MTDNIEPMGAQVSNLPVLRELLVVAPESRRIDSCAPIPLPWKQCWRELRIRLLPLIVFGCLVAAAITLWRYYVIGQ